MSGIFHLFEGAHKAFVQQELQRLLHVDSFTSRIWKRLGDALHYRLVDWPDESETSFSRFAPVEALFLWISNAGGLDPEWLANDDGRYVDDEGNEIPPSILPIYSGAEQLAAYGLWLLMVELETLGNPAAKGLNEQGWSVLEVVDHQARCLLSAYQALCYAQRLKFDTQLRREEIENSKRINFSAFGKSGAEKRHAPMRELKAWTIEQYRIGKWPSANKAAHELKERVIVHGRSIGAVLADENAQRTIADWIRRSV